MKSLTLCIVALTLMTTSGCGKARGNSAEAAAISLIEKLGGRVELDGTSPEASVVKVYLHQTKVTDTDLAIVGKLAHLKNLFLAKTDISDAGLAHITGAVRLETLGLNRTKVTDAGLTHLVGLQNLKTLNLQETKVSQAGADGLRKVLPKVTIAR